MRKGSNFEVDYDFFSGAREEDMAWVSFKENFIQNATHLEAKKLLFDYLDLIAKSDEIKVLLLTGSPSKVGREDYIRFYRQILKVDFDARDLARLYNAVNQLVLKIVGFGKPIVHADSGKVISLYMNISLACDYRIIGDNCVFQNPYLDLGLIPKGGGAFFLYRLLGFSKALEILLSHKDITADEAFKLGIVNKVVPVGQLKEEARKIAQEFTGKPIHSLSGIKKLLRCCMRDLEDCLVCENELLLQMVSRDDFTKKLLNPEVS
ncbi:MAG: enoyl-CoA hydratase/isomerase family protein [Deltaproteobacteria bacterium]|nr:MAG: enoyl-CoA hydratase/isomerase family protein [Deltaproteobacteria bacterium]